MAKQVIPQIIYAGFRIRPTNRNQRTSDGGKNVALAFVTYQNQKGELQHKEAFDRWRDTDIPRIPFDNVPTAEMVITGFATRYSTSNKLIRVEDPRGFQVEITVENFINMIQNITIENSVVKDECAWGWSGGKLMLFKVGSDEYLEAKANFDYDGQKSIPIKQVNIGDECHLGNGKTGIYYGGWHTVEASWNFNVYYLDEYNVKDLGKSKKYYYFKVGDIMEKYSSANVKAHEPGIELTEDRARETIESKIDKHINLSICKSLARKALKAKGIESSWNNPEAAKINRNFGLSDGGYCFQGEKNSWYGIFNSIVMIDDKPIKLEDLLSTIRKKINKYESKFV